MPEPDPLARRHLVAGWGGLSIFVTLGIALEALLAWKTPAYVDVGSEARRTMWRLAHAHGTGLSFLQILYALTLRHLPAAGDALTSACLLAGLVLVPLGFFGGGVAVNGGDPAPFVLLVPAGAVALVVGVARVALVASKRA
jgi:hypothetical protein